MAILISIFAMLISSNGWAGEPVPLFRTNDALEVTISAPWRTIQRDRRNQDPYPALLRYVADSGEMTEIPLTVERRGRSRQQLCDFPPIRLRFKRSDVKGTLFEGNRSIKMVTHCKPGKRYEQYYVLEMLAYHIYNLVTDLSFRAKPLSITYHDDQRNRDDGPRFAFLIEHDRLVARRHGMERFEPVEIRPRQLEAVESSRFALFQYLIGNVDWSSLGGAPGGNCCHNAKLIGPESGEPLYALPYDFDSAGLVDAEYAAPDESLPIMWVTDRLYRGFCVHNDTLEAARAEMLALEDEILAIVENESRLQARTRKRVTQYLEEFFEIIQDPRKFEREITSACRK
ncbi:MAG: hypothetical protein ACNA7E_08645 [Wenzhouxiangellaceae bacterium]